MKNKFKIRVGIIGDFNPSYPSHVATNEAIRHAERALSISTEISWISTIDLEKQINKLEEVNALWCSPGSPYKRMKGALKAVNFAREKAYPFIGT